MSQTEVQLIKADAVQTADIANSAVTDAKIAGLTSSKLTGALPAISGAALTNLPASGITEADQWRVTSNFDSSGTTITSNWARHSLYGAGQLGTGMSESSGIFTFPSTGIYKIDFLVVAYRISASNVRFVNQYIMATTDNSNYNEAAYASGSISNDAEAFTCGYCSHLFDVTNVSTHKVKFFVQAEQELRWYGYPNNSVTAIFTRLGDT